MRKKQDLLKLPSCPQTAGPGLLHCLCLKNCWASKTGRAFALLDSTKTQPNNDNKKPNMLYSPLASLAPYQQMREQIRAFQGSHWFSHDEVPLSLMALILPMSSFSPPTHLASSCSLCLRPSIFACSHKHFNYPRSSASSGKIIMDFHELLQMDCDLELMIWVQDLALSDTGFDQEPFLACAYRSISRGKCCKKTLLTQAE